MIRTPGSRQCVAAPNVDGKADVYALGVILYEMLSGRLPFVAKHGFDFMAAHVRLEPEPIGEPIPDLPPEVANLVHSMLVRTRAAAEHGRGLGLVAGAAGSGAVAVGASWCGWRAGGGGDDGGGGGDDPGLRCGAAA